MNEANDTPNNNHNNNGHSDRIRSLEFENASLRAILEGTIQAREQEIARLKEKLRRIKVCCEPDGEMQ
jgi:hypothetical protein